MDAAVHRIRPEADTTAAGAVRPRKQNNSTQSPEGDTTTLDIVSPSGLARVECP